MALNVPVNCGQAVLGTAEVALYTANSPTVVREIRACNTSASSVTVSLSILPSGGASGDANRLVKNYPLAPAPNGELVLRLIQPVGIGGRITGVASLGGAVSVIAAGLIPDDSISGGGSGSPGTFAAYVSHGY